MSHYSDFSYLQRCALWVYMGAFLLYRIWNSDKFRCLRPRKIFSGELRSIITVLYILMLIMQASWDIVGAWIKYSEDYMVIPGTDKIIGTPYDLWTPHHKYISVIFGYVECVNLAMQTGVLVLLQCFWNYLSNSVAKRSFMTSFEFKLYIVWALGGIIVFPVLQWSFRNDALIGEVVPLFVYAVEAVIISGLGIRTHYRFKRMLDNFAGMDQRATIIERLTYFQDMNSLLTIVLFLYGLSMGILCADAVTEAKVIATSKFGTDLLTANCNTCAALMWVIAIFIFHPRQNRTGTDNSTMHSSTANNNNSRSVNNRSSRIVVTSRIGDIESRNNNNGCLNEQIELTGGIKINQQLSERVSTFVENRSKSSHSTDPLASAGSMYSSNDYRKRASEEHAKKTLSTGYNTTMDSSVYTHDEEWLQHSPLERK